MSLCVLLFWRLYEAVCYLFFPFRSDMDSSFIYAWTCWWSCLRWFDCFVSDTHICLTKYNVIPVCFIDMLSVFIRSNDACLTLITVVIVIVVERFPPAALVVVCSWFKTRWVPTCRREAASVLSWSRVAAGFLNPFITNQRGRNNHKV